MQNSLIKISLRRLSLRSLSNVSKCRKSFQTNFPSCSRQTELNERHFSVNSVQMRDVPLSFNPFSRLMQRKTEFASAVDMYKECSRKVESDKDFFVGDVKLPDTFETWFLLTLVHVWLLNCRLRACGMEGRRVAEDISSTLWVDIEKRLYEGGIKNWTVISKTLKDLISVYYGTTLAYDEGLAKGDAILASALWRNLFSSSETTDAETLTKMVRYVRQQLQHLDSMEDDAILDAKWQFK